MQEQAGHKLAALHIGEGLHPKCVYLLLFTIPLKEATHIGSVNTWQVCFCEKKEEGEKAPDFKLFHVKIEQK